MVKLVVCGEGQWRHAVEGGGEGGVDTRVVGAREARPLLRALELGNRLEVKARDVALALGLRGLGAGGGQGQVAACRRSVGRQRR